MKAISYLAILASIGFAGCAAESTNLARTTTHQVNRQAPPRVPVEPHPIPHEMWGATSALVGKDSP